MFAALRRWWRDFVERHIVAVDPHDPPYPKGFQMPQLHGVTVPEADLVDVESMTCLLLAATEGQTTPALRARAVHCAMHYLSDWRNTRKHWSRLRAGNDPRPTTALARATPKRLGA